MPLHSFGGGEVLLCRFLFSSQTRYLLTAQGANHEFGVCMPQVHYPSLSPDGWITNSEAQADLMFSHFFASDYSQTYIYASHVSSFAYVLQKAQGDMSYTCTLLRQTLQEFFGHFFTSVVVEVKEDANPTGTSAASLSIYVQFTDSEGDTISLGKVIQNMGTKLQSIINLNNYGT